MYSQCEKIQFIRWQVSLAFWTCFSVFWLIVSRSCGVTVALKSATMRRFDLASCKSKAAVFNRCRLNERIFSQKRNKNNEKESKKSPISLASVLTEPFK